MPLPMVLSPVSTTSATAPAEPALPAAAPIGSIEVALPGGIRVKIIGVADAKTVSAVLGTLMAKRRR
jgi:hypothetical protein